MTPKPPQSNSESKSSPVARPILAGSPVKPLAPSPAAAAGVKKPLRPIMAPTARPTTTTLREDDESESQSQVDFAELIKGAPPWLVSLVFHLVLLVVLGLLIFSTMGSETLEVVVTEPQPVLAEELGEQIEVSKVKIDREDPDKEHAISDSTLPEVADPIAAPPEEPIIPESVTGATSDIQAPDVGYALNGRERGMKKALLGRYGGNETTEKAVMMALEWLKRNQRTDGSWSLSGPYDNVDFEVTENVAAATAMALLAYQGAGFVHNEKSRFQTQVARGWTAMLKLQKPDGSFWQSGTHHSRIYTHAQAAIAVCEIWAMTKDERFKGPAQKAIAYLVKHQAPEGGWRYVPGQDSDVSVTGWVAMALQSTRMGGLDVPKTTLDKIGKYLDTVADENGAKYRYRQGRPPTPAMTAEGLLARQYLGWKKNDKRLVGGVKYLAEHPIQWSKPDVYAWYYITQVMHHMEEPFWDEWNKGVLTLPTKQVQKGNERGSWSPARDQWGPEGGRLFVTCLSTYMLEVYYRHLPIYRYRPSSSNSTLAP